MNNVGAVAQKAEVGFKPSGVNATCDRCPNSLLAGYWEIGKYPEMLCGQCKDRHLRGGKPKKIRCLIPQS